MRPLPSLLPDFWSCDVRLWRDRLGQISLSTTTLFWGVTDNCVTWFSLGRPPRWATA